MSSEINFSETKLVLPSLTRVNKLCPFTSRNCVMECALFVHESPTIGHCSLTHIKAISDNLEG